MQLGTVSSWLRSGLPGGLFVPAYGAWLRRAIQTNGVPLPISQASSVGARLFSWLQLAHPAVRVPTRPAERAESDLRSPSPREEAKSPRLGAGGLCRAVERGQPGAGGRGSPRFGVLLTQSVVWWSHALRRGLANGNCVPVCAVRPARAWGGGACTRLCASWPFELRGCLRVGCFCFCV